MTNRRAITDDDLQDYIEGRLDDSARRHVEEELARDPRLADEVARLRRQAAKLQEFGKRVLDEPIPQEMLDLINKFGK
jgi:anti-sigma factor RsiW